jgi:Domain of Unknown Function (DUF1080)/Domain of unknown function (DUF3471)
MTGNSTRFTLVGLVAACGIGAALAAQDERSGTKAPRWRQHDMRRPRPPVIEPADGPFAAKPPKGAVILFDGSSLDAWQAVPGGPARWKIGEGYFETKPGTGPIETKAKFGDVQLHVEWAAPDPPAGRGQDRGNSGIFLMKQFEIQVLDSYKADTYADGQAAAIYGQYPPLFNASRPPGQWQAYDIAFRRPRFDASDKLQEPARVTVFHNGILVQNNEEPIGPTHWLKWLPYTNAGERASISLQDHDHPVRYRNIWLIELPQRAAPTEQELARPSVITLPAHDLDQYAGKYRLHDRPDAAVVSIAREEGHLVVSFPFRPQPLEILPISETEFDMPYTYGRFTFHKDAQGEVTSVLFRIGDGQREMKKIAH